MILVTGARGNVGREVTSLVVAGGEEVRVLSRRASVAPRQPGVEQMTGDLNHPDTVRPALKGVQAVFLLPGYQDMPGLVNEMRRAGTKRVVLLSGRSVDDDGAQNAISRYMILSEEAVRSSKLGWTILRPSGFMSNTLQWIPQLHTGNLIRAPFADVPIAMIDPYDIAAVAGLALSSDDHAGQHYSLSGPEQLRPADRVRTLAAVLHRDLSFEGQSAADARAEMSRTTPPEYVEAFFRFYAQGTIDESEVRRTVETLTGQPPRTFEQWVINHADAFTQPPPL